MSDIVTEIDRVLAEELAERELDRVVDLAQAGRAALRVHPWQRDLLRRVLQPGAFTLASLPLAWCRIGGTER
ncbi:hypothetical protein C5E45_32915 [Nocardia nova]|uniref:Uncharacterized protein n=1 Tax=Nocardia nova TaxID=37330 RepID=A0A2S6ACS2_9NOCA|nr:hypothetical protein [Nocardia nova]PPJ31894.1 hypothetical protein C5E45_32915 [Nocardia nova]